MDYVKYLNNTTNFPFEIKRNILKYLLEPDEIEQLLLKEKLENTENKNNDDESNDFLYNSYLSDEENSDFNNDISFIDNKYCYMLAGIILIIGLLLSTFNE